MSRIRERRAGKGRRVVSPAVPFYRGDRLSPPKLHDVPKAENTREVRAWLRTVPRPWAVDLFSGAGGLSLGLMEAGINVIVAADSDAASVETHAANLGSLPFQGDLASTTRLLTALERWGVSHVDIVAGGPPCQPFSRAGSAKIRDLVRQGARPTQDARTGLWRSFLRVVDALQPRVVLFENVPDLANWDDGSLLSTLIWSLRERGFRTEVRILDAFRFGVPQHRARLFLVGLRGGTFDWPKPTNRRQTLRDAIGDLPRVGPAQRKTQLPYKGPKTPLQRLLRRGVSRMESDLIMDHVTRDVRPDDARAFALMKPGQTYKDLPARLRRYRADIFDDKYKRLEWGNLSRTITAHIAKDAYWYIHPSQDRTLSIREAARIQTFPDWFRFAGHPSDQLRQIGNAVPPLLSVKIATAIAAAIQAPDKALEADIAEFRKSLLRWHRKHRLLTPWRLKRKGAWKAFLGEVGLARLPARRVAPAFRRLESRAPSPSALLRNTADIRRWAKREGLEARMETLIRATRVLSRKFNGRIPDDDLGLRAIPGVGDFAASAVRSFGLSRSVVLTDNTTSRIVQRISGRRSMPRWQLRLEVLQLAGRAGPDPEFNAALLDFGTLVCRARGPDCAKCPVLDMCRTGRASRTE